MTKSGPYKQYDISLLRTSGTEVGLMLVRNKDGTTRYERFADEQLAQQFFTGEPGYGYLPPQKELAHINGSHTAGFGQEFYDETGVNEKKYYTSVGCDLRFSDNAILGPTYTALTLTDYSATITDEGLELWADANTLTNWTKSGGGTLTRESTTKHGGTYSAKFDQNGANVMNITQSLTWNTKYQGVRVTVTVYIYQDTADAVDLDIFDGTDRKTVLSGATTGSWVQLTATHPMNAGATELTISITGNILGGASVTYVDDFDWVAPIHAGMRANAHAQFNDELYIGYGDVLVKLNSTGDGFDYVYNFDGDTIWSLEIFTDDNMYIGLGTAAYYYMNTSESFTESNLGGADQTALYFRNVNGVMYKYVATNVISKSTDPTNAGSWSTATSVGTQDESVVEIKSIRGTPYIGKYDMPYYLDSSDDDFPITEDVRFLDRTANCVGMNSWHDKLYIPIGASGLMEYDGTDITWRSPSRFCTNLPDHATQVSGVAGDEEYLYVLQVPDTGNIYPLLAGQLRTIDGTTVWAWHPIQHIDASTVATGLFAGSLFISSVYKKRIWISHFTNSGSIAKMYWLPLTTQYGDITGDSDYTYLTGGYFITPWLHANFKADSKSYFRLTLTTQGCDATNYVTASYQTYYTALGGSWTSLGNFTTSPVQTKYFTSTGSGTMIRFKFALTTASTSTTPKLINYDCRGIWRPTRRKLIAMVVNVGDNVLTKNGTKSSENETSMSGAVEECIDKVWPNTYYDIDGSTKYVAVLYHRKHDVKLIKGQNPQYKYDLLLEEITLA